MSTKKITIGLILILFCSMLRAQDRLFVDPGKLDSLKVIVFKRNHNDKEKIRLLN